MQDKAQEFKKINAGHCRFLDCRCKSNVTASGAWPFVTGRADGWIFSVVNSCRESLAWLPLDCADQFLFTRASQGVRVFVFNAQAPENTFRSFVSLARDTDFVACSRKQS